MEDMPQIFDRIEFSTTVKPGFDIYLVDDIHDQKPQGLVVHFKSNFTLFITLFRYLPKHIVIAEYVWIRTAREVWFSVNRRTK